MQKKFTTATSFHGTSAAKHAMFQQELSWRTATKKAPEDTDNHLNLSRVLLNLGKIEEAKTHAGIVFLFLSAHSPAFQINQRTNLTTDLQHQILNEDPMLMKNPENMALHENRVLRLIFQENTAAAIEYGRNLVTFAPKLKIGEAQRIYLNATASLLTSPNIDKAETTLLLKQELEIAKTLKVCTPKEKIKFFVNKMSKASGRNMHQLLAEPMQSLQNELQEESLSPALQSMYL